MRDSSGFGWDGRGGQKNSQKHGILGSKKTGLGTAR